MLDRRQPLILLATGPFSTTSLHSMYSVSHHAQVGLYQRHPRHPRHSDTTAVPNNIELCIGIALQRSPPALVSFHSCYAAIILRLPTHREYSTRKCSILDAALRDHSLPLTNHPAKGRSVCFCVLILLTLSTNPHFRISPPNGTANPQVSFYPPGSDGGDEVTAFVVTWDVSESFNSLVGSPHSGSARVNSTERAYTVQYLSTSRR